MRKLDLHLFVVSSAIISLSTMLMPLVGHAQGIALTGVGAVNRSMGGAATAAPLDSAGAIYWNPATIGALPHSEIEVGLELLLPRERLSSSVNANALGAGVPPVDLSGSSEGEPGVTPIPNVAFVYQPQDSSFSYGLGILSVGGFSANYPASSSNPVLSPQAPLGLGLGRIESRVEIIQIVPTVACHLSEQVYVGVAPTVTMARVSAAPGFLDAPDDANGDTFSTYEPATGSRYNWGGGYQVGAYYKGCNGFNFGVTYKSTQWFETLEFNSADELGRPRTLELDLEYPPIVSLGTSYTAMPCWVFACDVRFFGWGGATGFGEKGFRADGAVAGLGWRDIWSLNLGAQRQIGRGTFIRAGYSCNENPIADEVSFFNVASPLIVQQVIYLGATTQITRAMDIHLAYWHAFENRSTGPFVSPAGPIPGTSVSSEISADAIVFGTTVRF